MDMSRANRKGCFVEADAVQNCAIQDESKRLAQASETSAVRKQNSCKQLHASTHLAGEFLRVDGHVNGPTLKTVVQMIERHVRGDLSLTKAHTDNGQVKAKPNMSERGNQNTTPPIQESKH
jgi:hypothetical protein